MNSERLFGAKEFEAAVGLPPGRLDARTHSLLDAKHLRFSPLSSDEQAVTESEILAEIQRGFTKVGEHRAGIWRDAWQEQLDAFIGSGHSIESLDPKFVGGSTILRWRQEYIKAVTPKFELGFLQVFRDWLFRTYLGDIDHLFEFGSGSAFNVAAYAQLFPDVRVTALDWAPAAVAIAELLGSRLRMNVTGQRFDFFSPSSDVKLTESSAALTMCALEQTGERFSPFIEYLITQRPKRVVHVEPVVELYDPNSSCDALAIKYHRSRQYLSGFLPYLQDAERAGRLTLQVAQRLQFGSRYHECFSIVVWQPT